MALRTLERTQNFLCTIKTKMLYTKSFAYNGMYASDLTNTWQLVGDFGNYLAKKVLKEMPKGQNET